MKPPTFYIQKVDEALALADTPPNNRFYQIQEAAAWAQLAELALMIDNDPTLEEPTDAD